jgi:hypothetical protein
MSTYRAPLRDMQFVLRELAGLDEIAKATTSPPKMPKRKASSSRSRRGSVVDAAVALIERVIENAPKRRVSER